MREALTQDHLPYIDKLNPGCSSRSNKGPFNKLVGGLVQKEDPLIVWTLGLVNKCKVLRAKGGGLEKNYHKFSGYFFHQPPIVFANSP